MTKPVLPARGENVRRRERKWKGRQRGLISGKKKRREKRSIGKQDFEEMKAHAVLKGVSQSGPVGRRVKLQGGERGASSVKASSMQGQNLQKKNRSHHKGASARD